MTSENPDPYVTLVVRLSSITNVIAAAEIALDRLKPRDESLAASLGEVTAAVYGNCHDAKDRKIP